MSIDISFNIQLAIAIVTSAFVGGISGYIGSLMLTKRMSLMGGALGHMTLPGIALGLAYGFDVSLGALLFLIVGIAAIWYIEIKTELPTESIVAIVFAIYYCCCNISNSRCNIFCCENNFAENDNYEYI